MPSAYVGCLSLPGNRLNPVLGRACRWRVKEWFTAGARGGGPMLSSDAKRGGSMAAPFGISNGGRQGLALAPDLDGGAVGALGLLVEEA